MNIAVQRLFSQGLENTPFQTPEDVVAWLGAVQAQEFMGALWALALRLPDTTESAVEVAFTNGHILRTHAMRPTWHFVTPEDIRWIQALTAPRVHALNAYYYRQLELDDALLHRSSDLIVGMLEGGQQLTRAEIGTALGDVGIAAESMRLSYIVMYAELEAIICSGPRRGKQFTYMLVDERAPDAKTMEHDAALAELTRRYFTSHGPATVQDFAWWSGLTQADVKAGLDRVRGDIVSEDINGKTYWFAESVSPTIEPMPNACLVPTYDEIVIGYTDRSDLFEQSLIEYPRPRVNLPFDSMIVMEGKIIGSWRRTFQKGTVVIQLAPFSPLTISQEKAVTSAARRYGEFLGLPVTLASTMTT